MVRKPELAKSERIMTDETRQEEIEGAYAESLPPRSLFAPQKSWHLFSLFIATFGIFACAFFYRHAKNLAALDTHKRRPWMWLFTPILAITIPFALDRMFDRFGVVAEKLAVDKPMIGSLGWICFVFYVVLRAGDRMGGPAGITLLFLLLLAAMFAILSARLNTVYDVIPQAKFKSTKYKLTVSSIIVLVLVSPIVIYIFVVLLQQDIDKYLRPRLAVGEKTELAGFPLHIIATDKWSLVKKGTSSDGSGDVELVGATAESFAVMFAHGADSSMEEIQNGRRDIIFAASANASCREDRSFEEPTLFRRSVLKCEAKRPNIHQFWVVTVLEDDDAMYELFSEATATSFNYQDASQALESLSKGFHHNRTSEEVR